MIPKFLKLKLKTKSIGRRVLMSGILAAGMIVLMGVASGCGQMGIPNPFAKKQYTILLHTFTSPNHVRQSKLYRDKTKELAGWRGLDVVHKDNHSELLWGKYGSMPDATDDLQTARTWRVPNVDRPAFPFPRVVLIPGEDIENPEYNLRNVKGGHWTVLVAIFSDDPDQGFVGRDRQKRALTYCEYLRKEGVEAYYDHTPGRSQVTVGVFPEKAVVMESKSQGGSILLPAPTVVAKQVVKDRRMLDILASKDPPLLYLIINAGPKYQMRRSRKTGKMIKAIVCSYPITIPGRAFNKDNPPVRSGGGRRVAPPTDNYSNR
jgi:hypothetical protein